jgi:hypothetical protein
MIDASLPSWSDGSAKTAIVQFLERVCDTSSPDYVPPSDRIATFDNDGTLWCERPLIPQLYFGQERLEALARLDPSIGDRYPLRAYLEHDTPKIEELGKQALIESMVVVDAGDTVDEFAEIASEWLARATNPVLGKRFIDLTYAPQIELLALLHAHEFKIFIVSGGGIDLIRGFSEQIYGIPRERVIGSSNKVHFEIRDGKAVVVKDAILNSFDDREAKVANIALHIGRRPILAFGNSDGDLAMMQYAMAGEGARLALLLHHDDEAREFAYDRDYALSPLSDALDRAAHFGITVVSMKKDWLKVWTPESA